MRSRLLLPLSTVALLVAGAVLYAGVSPVWGHDVWMFGAVILGAPIVWSTVRAALRGHFATDVVASLSIIGAVVLSQPLAGLVIVLMQSGGEALERFAEGRASAAVRALEEAAPRTARRLVGEREEEVPAASIVVGDELRIRPGDMIPCDGVVTEGESEIDTSSLTGEPMPVRATTGARVMSGTLNGLGVLRMRATAVAAQSQYARIVELVRTAQASKAPLQRIADRYAIWFTPITLVLCGIAVFLSHDWTRALAILVVATPCPLILATPVAIIGGINRAARRQIIIRHGGALEHLSEIAVAVFDKTGTITIGKPQLRAIRTNGSIDQSEALRLAASVEQGSSHLLGRVLVEAAEERRIPLAKAANQIESPGRGVSGVVDGRRVRVGARSFALPECDEGVLAAARLESPDATLRAYVAVDDKVVAVMEYADEMRADLTHVLDSLHALAIDRVVLLSGDHAPIARAVAERAGIRETYGDLLPSDKATFVERLRAEDGRVMMVGDGINDAPALSAADVGIAMAGRGGGVTTEAADVVILVDALDRVTDAITISRRTMRIAKQSIRVGLGLSVLAMIVAAFGVIPPVAGAGLQELIDVAVILNALRTSAGPRDRGDQGGTLRRRLRSTRNSHGRAIHGVRGVSPLRA